MRLSLHPVKKFDNGTITAHAEFVFEENPGQGNHVIIVTSSFSKSLLQKKREKEFVALFHFGSWLVYDDLTDVINTGDQRKSRDRGTVGTEEQRNRRHRGTEEQ